MKKVSIIKCRTTPITRRRQIISLTTLHGANLQCLFIYMLALTLISNIFKHAFAGPDYRNVVVAIN